MTTGNIRPLGGKFVGGSVLDPFPLALQNNAKWLNGLTLSREKKETKPVAIYQESETDRQRKDDEDIEGKRRSTSDSTTQQSEPNTRKTTFVAISNVTTTRSNCQQQQLGGNNASPINQRHSSRNYALRVTFIAHYFKKLNTLGATLSIQSVLRRILLADKVHELILAQVSLQKWTFHAVTALGESTNYQKMLLNTI